MTTPIKLPHHLDVDQLTCRAVIETPKAHDPSSITIWIAACFSSLGQCPLEWRFP